MKDSKKILKKQILQEEFDAEYEREPSQKGTYSKPIILQQLVEAFDHFRLGMDEIANVYNIMETVDPELYRKISVFGDNMSKMIDGLAKLIQQQGGSIKSTTKPEALKKYFSKQRMNAIGLNENKSEVFNTRVDLNIDRIKTIMLNSKR